MKQAILVVSFGTTHLDTLEHSITRLEQYLAEQFPDRKIYRAFTSPTIRARLLRDHGIRIPSVQEALEMLQAQGYDCVTVQPTLLIPGEEFDRLNTGLAPFGSRMMLRLGKPLLWEEQDLDNMVQLLQATFCPPVDTVLLMMGHGTEHPANACYVRLAEKMRASRSCCMRLCTVEGIPTFAQAVEELSALPQRRVIAAPMMLVAGDHARNDMSGAEPDSLRSMLEQAGFSVECRIQGLGELEAVRQIYARRIRDAQPL